MISTNAQQVPVAALHDIDVRQSITQKARGVGDVIIWIDRGNVMERVVLESIADFRAVQQHLNSTAFAARLAIKKVENTRHFGDGTPVVQAPVQFVEASPSPGSTPTLDWMDQLTKLAQLRDAGILSSEEFEAKKAEILAGP